MEAVCGEGTSIRRQVAHADSAKKFGVGVAENSCYSCLHCSVVLVALRHLPGSQSYLWRLLQCRVQRHALRDDTIRF